MDSEKVTNWYLSVRPVYKKLAEKIENILGELIQESQIDIHVISSRPKTIESFVEKVKRKSYDDPENQIHDLAGIRIITYVENDVERISQLIKTSFNIDKKNSVDKKKELGTDKFGYQSVHFVAQLKKDRLLLPEYKKFKGLKFEIQLRTLLQHTWAEISHDRNYKFSGKLPFSVERRFSLVAGSVEMADREFDVLATEIDKITSEIDSGELDLPLNSTTIKQYLENKLQQLIEKGLPNRFYAGKDESVMIKELENFGIYNLKELDALITKKFLSTYNELSIPSWNNYSSFLQNLMIVTDYQKYFEKSWHQDWSTIHEDEVRILRSFNVPLNIISKEYGLEIKE